MKKCLNFWFIQISIAAKILNAEEVCLFNFGKGATTVHLVYTFNDDISRLV